MEGVHVDVRDVEGCGRGVDVVWTWWWTVRDEEEEGAAAGRAPELGLAILEVEGLDGARRVAHLEDVLGAGQEVALPHLLDLIQEAAQGRRARGGWRVAQRSPVVWRSRGCGSEGKGVAGCGDGGGGRGGGGTH